MKFSPLHCCSILDPRVKSVRISRQVQAVRMSVFGRYCRKARATSRSSASRRARRQQLVIGKRMPAGLEVKRGRSSAARRCRRISSPASDSPARPAVRSATRSSREAASAAFGCFTALLGIGEHPSARRRRRRRERWWSPRRSSRSASRGAAISAGSCASRLALGGQPPRALLERGDSGAPRRRPVLPRAFSIAMLARSCRRVAASRSRRSCRPGRRAGRRGARRGGALMGQQSRAASSDRRSPARRARSRAVPPASWESGLARDRREPPRSRAGRRGRDLHAARPRAGPRVVRVAPRCRGLPSAGASAWRAAASAAAAGGGLRHRGVERFLSSLTARSCRLGLAVSAARRLRGAGRCAAGRCARPSG